MSPLACSLLALAALFAAADALKPNPYCSAFKMGKQARGGAMKRFVMRAVGEKTFILPDKCARPGSQLAGYFINVCNTPNYKPIIQLMMGRKNALYISCPRSVEGCSNLKLSVTQYCKPAGLPPGPFSD